MDGIADPDMQGHEIRPGRTHRIDISPDEYRLANRLQLLDEIEIPHISGVKNKRRPMLFK